jgi:hypothetical protein
MSFATFVVCILIAAPPAAPAEKPERETARKALVATMAAEIVEGYEVTRGKEKPVKLVLHKNPILRWSNPAAGSVYGDVYIWTADGRPEVLASIYRWYQPYKSQTAELHSLSAEQVALTSKQSKMWGPAAPGVSFQEAKDFPPPAATAAQRLQQMRRLSSEFSVRLIDTREDKIKGVERELRMLNQPVYRYESKNPSLIDGAMFAFVEGTDPEAWLLLEAHKTAEKSTWKFAFARMNNDELHGFQGKTEVWKVAKSDAGWLGRDQVYGLFPVNEIPWKDAAE